MMKVRFNERVPLRDGVTVSADLYLCAEPAPVVIARTPYNKNTEFCVDKARLYHERGYHFMWVDVRGRGDSDGVFEPYRNEGPDGYDVIEWAAQQPWCDGKVATWGQSYLGAAQWLAAIEQPPSLAAMVVYVTPSDPFIEWPSGIHSPQQIYWHRMVDGRIQQHADAIDFTPVYRHLPLMTMDEAAGFHSVAWRNDLNHGPAETEYWDPLAFQHKLGDVTVPTLGVTGWYDDVQPGTLISFARMTDDVHRANGSAAAQRLVVGPWDHALTRNRSRTMGRLDFGPDHEFDLDAFELDWLDHYVRGIDNGADRQPLARLFAMGRNEWRTADAWPLRETEWTPYYLSSSMGAGSRFGDGTLSIDRGVGRDSFRYDPADPVPFLTEPTSHQIGGPDDYATVEERADVLVYSTPELVEDVEVTGPVTARLYVSSDAPDTDFMGKLIDVHPDGYCQRLCDGMVRMRFRDGMETDSRMEPGEIYAADLHLWSTSHVFKAGHRIRLEVASSAFPKYDRNLNTGDSLAEGTEMRVAVNTVWHDEEHPSHLMLPIIPAAGGADAHREGVSR